MKRLTFSAEHISGCSRYAFCSLLLLITSLTQAQDKTSPWTGGGELENVEVEIINERENTVPAANRNFEKIPPRPAEQITPPIRYDFQSFNFVAPQINPQIRPLKIKAANPSKVYGGYLRAGYGNFASPLLEGYITSRRDKDKLIGAHLYHFSSAKGPVDGRNSGSGNTSMSVFGRTFSQYVAVSGAIDAQNRTTHFYGYPSDTDVEIDRKDIRQSYNHFKMSGEIANAKNSDFSYKLGGLFSYMADRYDARELEGDVNFNSAYKVSETSRFNIDAAYVFLSRKDTEVSGKARNLFSVTPSYAFEVMDELRLRIGVDVAFENDDADAKDLHIYPDISASYPVSPSVDVVGSLSGGMEKVSLQSLSYENIWIGPNVPVIHRNKNYDLSLGIRARVGNKVAAHAGFSFANFTNMHFFVNNADDVSKFDVEYEFGFFRRTNLFGSLSFVQSEAFKFMLRGDVFGYGRETDNRDAWHLPRYKMNANASVNLMKKLLLTADVIGQGGLKAFNPITEKTETLKGALDLNAKLEYLFSDSFSLFVQFNNITGNEYPVYLFYPVRGFQFLGGLTWSF